jgi:hypothetical protein
MKRIITSVLVVLTLVLSAANGQSPLADRKLLKLGWGTPMAETLPDKIEDMEKWNPFFDGFVIGVTLRGDVEAKAGREFWDTRFCWCGFGAGRIKWENVAEDVASLRAAAEKARRVKMFARYCVIPGNVDWFDPAWEAIIHNAGITGRLVREGKCKGIFFDIEEYGKEKYGQGRPFQYNYLAGRKKHTFDEYVNQVFLRGKQWIEAFQKEAPDAVILFSWAHSRYTYNQWRNEGGKPDWEKPAKLSASKYLLAPFIDGVLAGAGEGIQIYDGSEYTYGFRTKADFELAREFVEQGWRYSLVPEIYKRKMKAAFATEMDRGYRNRGGWHPNEPELNYFTPEQLAMALHHSLAAGDGYSWVWSEASRWWPHEKLSEAYLEAFSEAKKARPFGLDPAENTKISLPVPTAGGGGIPRATEVRGPNPEVLFRDLWKTHELVLDLPIKAKFATDPKGVGEKEEWFTVDFDDSSWGTIRVDDFWEHQGYPEYDEEGWYRIRFDVSKEAEGRKLFLSFGRMDEAGVIWLNGDKVGDFAGPWSRRFEIEVTDAIKAGQENVLAVKVFGGFGAGGLWAPIKLITQK